APLHGDLVDTDAEFVAGQHGPDGRVALAVRRGPGQDRGAAVGVHLDGGVLPRAAFLHPQSGDLDVAGQADAQLHDVAVGPPFRLVATQVLVARRDQRQLQRASVVAAVVYGAEGGR